MRGALGIGIVLLATGSGGCARTLCHSQPAGWRTARSEHFVLYTDTWNTRFGPLLERMENKYAALRASFFKDVAPAPVEVVLFADHTEFIDHFGYWRSAVTLKEGGARQPGGGIVLLGSDDETSMMHQLAHRFIEATTPGAPHWFHEGFALYLENTLIRQ